MYHRLGLVHYHCHPAKKGKSHPRFPRSAASAGATTGRPLAGGRPGTYQEDGEGVRIHGVLLSRAVTDHAYTGNAQIDGAARRGWILGHFMPAGDIRHSEDLEIRWAIHQPGERRAQWVADERRSTAIILISGRFKVELPGRSIVLSEQGDYVVFHGISHSWEAETRCVIVGIRWPSVSGYQSPADLPE